MYQGIDNSSGAALDKAAHEALSRIRALRERLVSQLHAASWSVTAACEHARDGDLDRAREEATRAGDLLYAVVESREPIAALLAVLEGSEP